MNLHKNQQGSILQIVLVIFMILNIFVLTISKLVVDNIRSMQRMEIINNNRIVELLFIQDIVGNVKNGQLSNSNITIFNTKIAYQIHENTNMYTIKATFETGRELYPFTIIVSSNPIKIMAYSYE